MKKTNVLLLSLALVAGLASCNNAEAETNGSGSDAASNSSQATQVASSSEIAPTLESYEAISAPNKTSYLIGESFDLSGFSLVAKYSDLSTMTIDNSLIGVSPSKFSSSDTSVTLSYDTFSVKYDVLVGEKVEAVDATCTASGNVSYYHVASNGKYYSDAEFKNEITLDDTVVSPLGHNWTFADVVVSPSYNSNNYSGARIYCANDPSEEYLVCTTKVLNINSIDVLKENLNNLHIYKYIISESPTATSTGKMRIELYDYDAQANDFVLKNKAENDYELPILTSGTGSYKYSSLNKNITLVGGSSFRTYLNEEFGFNLMQIAPMRLSIGDNCVVMSGDGVEDIIKQVEFKVYYYEVLDFESKIMTYNSSAPIYTQTYKLIDNPTFDAIEGLENIEYYYTLARDYGASYPGDQIPMTKGTINAGDILGNFYVFVVHHEYSESLSVISDQTLEHGQQIGYKCTTSGHDHYKTVGETEKAFYIFNEDSFKITTGDDAGYYAVTSPTVNQGSLKVGDKVSVPTTEGEKVLEVKKLRIARTQVDKIDSSSSGIGIFFSQEDLGDATVDRGTLITLKGKQIYTKSISATVYALTKDEGGRHTPFSNDYKPSVYIGAADHADVIDTLTIVESENDGLVFPGETATINITFKTEVPLWMGINCTVLFRESGKTVAKLTNIARLDSLY